VGDDADDTGRGGLGPYLTDGSLMRYVVESLAGSGFDASPALEFCDSIPVASTVARVRPMHTSVCATSLMRFHCGHDGC
jgi:hypothetical protein